MIRLAVISFVLISTFLLLLLWIWSFIHVLLSRLTKVQKIFWILCMLFIPLVTNILYLIFIHKKGELI